MKLILDYLVGWDKFMFTKINQDWTNSWFDVFFPAITDFHKRPETLYILLPLFLAIYLWRTRVQGIKILCVLLLSLGVTDFVTYRLIKEQVERLRPNHTNSSLKVILRVPDHSGNSFPSNHAANMFAFAAVVGEAATAWAPLALLFAFLVAYSRVYVGVHYPLDILAGALVGYSIAKLVWYSLRFIGLPRSAKQRSSARSN